MNSLPESGEPHRPCHEPPGAQHVVEPLSHLGADARHERWMLYALSLAERGRLSTAPNPWVGCVIVAADGVEAAEETIARVV